MSGCSSDSALGALQCHFTWDLSCRRSTLLRLRDKLIDICPGESTPWKGQIHNLQGFLQARLGHFSEALSLLLSASEALTGPGLLVNYSDLAWLHHEKGEQEQSQEYLSRVEEVSRKYPTEGDQPYPEVLAEKAWTLMKFSPQQKLEAVELFEAALEQEPERAQWRSSQVIAIASAQKHNPNGVDNEVLRKMQRAHEDDPENLYLSAEYLSQRAQRGEEVKDDVDELANKIIFSANSSYSGLKVILRFYRQIKHVDGAIFWADEALEKHPDSRYVIRCAALCYKWRVLFSQDGASQRRLLDRAVSLLQQVIELYPDSALVKEMDLADLYSKSERSKAEEMYRKLLQMEMDLPERQMFYNRYAKYLQYNLKDIPKCIQYHKKASLINHESFFKENSKKAIESFKKDGWVEAQSSPLSTRLEELQELQCHFTWELHRSEAMLLSVRDRLEDFLTESTPWKGQNYNLQGFLQARLGHFSEAFSLLHSASEALTGPGLLVNYSDLAWLHHERGEQEQSQEYLSRVEKLSRKYPTEVDQPHPEVLAEKAWTTIEVSLDHGLATRLFQKALESEERVEWRTCYALALLYAHNKHKNGNPDNILQEMKQALNQDPENLLLRAEYLNLQVQRVCTTPQQREEAAALAAQLLEKSTTLHRDIRSVLELQRRTVSVDAAVDLAEKALQKLPDSRYLKSCLAMCLKWQMDQQRESASQELIERTAALLGEVISLYPDSCFRTEIDLANVLAKSNHSLTQADRLYQDLLQRDLDPASKQMLYNNYAKFLYFEMQKSNKSIEYHLRTARIPIKSNCRSKSIAILRKVQFKYNGALRRELQEFLVEIKET
ncbi:uncharacterized protein [Eucyclogobius newberryi]|uniref:uncharacterized protein n=1 Tax=Eucyclogobius newberryi TaxID=166745 RepID=UPI003B5B943C